MVGLVYGPSLGGKSTLVRAFRKRGSVPTYSSDAFFLVNIKRPDIAPKSPMYAMITEELAEQCLNLAAEKLIAIDAVEEFCRDFVKSMPLDEDLVLVEGEVFSNDVIREAFVNELKKNDIVVWEISRA